MRHGILLAGAALVLTSTLALAAPESLLPGQYDNPAPTPAPRAAPAPAPAAGPASSGAPSPVVLPLPGASSGTAPAAPVAR